ncbi:MAG: hypothetical protein ABI978_05980 [Chloroflexota bacterium]
MTQRTSSRRWVVPLVLGDLLVVGLMIRFMALDLPGHYGDSVVMTRWAETMARYGPFNFYQHDGSVYPALLYIFWPLGVLFDGAELARVVKGLSIPFDIAIGIVVYLTARRMVGGLRALIAPAVYLLNPAVLLAGPVWGQIDAAGTLAYLCTLLAAASGRLTLASALAVVAVLIKPQFGLVALPVGMLAILAWRATGRWIPLVNAALAALIAYLFIAIPLGLDPISFISRAAGIAADKPVTSANAPNIWGVLVGYSLPDTNYAFIGGALLLLGLVASLIPLWFRRDLKTVLAVGLFLVLAFYFLPTRIHERYLFPAFAILAPLAATSWRVLIATLLLTVAYTLTLLYALVSTTPFKLPPSIEHVLVTRTAAIWIGMTLMATSATLVLLLVRRRPVADPVGGGLAGADPAGADPAGAT